MQDLTFGEQVKIVLSRKNMTIKELAKQIEIRTRKKMSRQNLTQRLGRDNFQEQDMRMIAEILECPFQLNILDDSMAAEKTELEIKPKESMMAEEVELTEGSVKEKEPAEKAEAAEELTETEEATAAKSGVPAETKAQESGQAVDEKNANEKAHERDITIGELVDIHKELDAMMIEKATGELPKVEAHLTISEEETQADSGLATETFTAPENPVYEMHEENNTEEPAENEAEPVEKILEEIESLEKEVRKEVKEEKPESQEEKAHGWRAYFMQRLKKRAKEQTPGDDRHAAGNETGRDENYLGGYDSQEEGSAGNTKDYIEGGYLKDIYLEDTYDENEYPEQGYAGRSYEQEYQMGYQNAEYQNAEYQDAGYQRVDYQNVGYDQEFYTEDAYAEEVPQEEEPVGEFNPYTGKEYESNSVRMHPSRIGYVQVYDRSNHQWTDMTEWAFLGYQERKKQLLGKDYDPPIYLD